MNLPLIVIRPEPGATATLIAARDMGLAALAYPLFSAEAVAWHAPDPAVYDGVLIGSANAIRHGGAGLKILRDLPAYAVGETTAATLRQAGFLVTATGKGGLQSVLDTLSDAKPLHLLRLAGEAHISLNVPDHITLTTKIVYRMIQHDFPPEMIAALQEQAIIALHSAEAARHFRAQCKAHAIDRTRLSLVTLGPRIEEAAGSGWGRIECSSTPDDAALLALAKRLCQTGA